MNKPNIFDVIKGNIIVSCQALECEPLYGAEIMAKMALAAKQGGAVGIRANTVIDIIAIKENVDLPIIGIIKRDYSDSNIYITPTIKEIEELVSIGVDIIATDCTDRTRPFGQTLEGFVKEVKARFPNQLLMADISTYEEGVKAQELGFDLVSTTLSGYTEYSEKNNGPDFELLERLSQTLAIPVIAEGRIYSPDLARKAFEKGAHSIVVGGAITRPAEITRRFVEGIGGE